MTTESALRAALEPCPFCASPKVRLNRPHNGERPFVMCDECFAAGPQAGEEEAIAGWNRRAAPTIAGAGDERAREVLAYKSGIAPSWREGILSGKNSDWGHIRPSEAIRAMLAYAAERVAEEREKNAKVAERQNAFGVGEIAMKATIATAIRAGKDGGGE